MIARLIAFVSSLPLLMSVCGSVTVLSGQPTLLGIVDWEAKLCVLYGS